MPLPLFTKLSGKGGRGSEQEIAILSVTSRTLRYCMTQVADS